jgi:hypothetical protein
MSCHGSAAKATVRLDSEWQRRKAASMIGGPPTSQRRNGTIRKKVSSLMKAKRSTHRLR